MTSVDDAPRDRTVPPTRLRAARLRGLLDALTSHEVLTFLLVGGAGYVVDIAVFNALGFTGPLARWHPVVARTIALVAAMTVTYIGNRTLTWRRYSRRGRRREISLFLFFNLVGFGISAGLLVLSHDVLGLTSRLADNISANVIGVGLGTAFRFVTYKRFVFVPQP